MLRAGFAELVTHIFFKGLAECKTESRLLKVTQGIWGACGISKTYTTAQTKYLGRTQELLITQLLTPRVQRITYPTPHLQLPTCGDQGAGQSGNSPWFLHSKETLWALPPKEFLDVNLLQHFSGATYGPPVSESPELFFQRQTLVPVPALLK